MVLFGVKVMEFVENLVDSLDYYDSVFLYGIFQGLNL